MSAWLVSEFHINAIVSWAAREGVPFVHYRTKEKAACALVAENMRSLNHRYRGEKFTKEWQEQAATYNFKSVSQEELKTFIKRTNVERNSERSIGNKLPPLTNEVIATQIIKACDCYHYQACEHDGYSDSDAHDFIELVKQAADRAGGQGDGKVYDQMLWGLD